MMIEAQGLTKTYVKFAETRGWPARRRSEPRARDIVAVDHVGFGVEKGELFVVMGLSGSGKSTLLRMLNRLVEPTEGSCASVAATSGR